MNSTTQRLLCVAAVIALVSHGTKAIGSPRIPMAVLKEVIRIVLRQSRVHGHPLIAPGPTRRPSQYHRGSEGAVKRRQPIQVHQLSDGLQKVPASNSDLPRGREGALSKITVDPGEGLSGASQSKFSNSAADASKSRLPIQSYPAKRRRGRRSRRKGAHHIAHRP